MANETDQMSERCQQNKKECVVAANAVVPEIEKLKEYLALVPEVFARVEYDITKRRPKLARKQLEKIKRSYTAMVKGLIAMKENERVMHLSFGTCHETLDPFVDKEQYPHMV